MWGVQTKIDGPFLAGVAAILVAIFTFILGILTLIFGQKKQQDKDDEPWKALAEILLEREKEEHEQKEP